MSKFNMEYIKCQKCGCEQTAKVYEEVNVTENQALKQKLLDHRLISVKCKKCGAESLNVYPFLYTDIDKKLLVWFIPTESEKEISDIIAGINDEMSLEEKNDSEFMMRGVGSFNELKEKIIIRDLDLDDRIIELIKIYYFTQALQDYEDLKNKDIEGMYLNNDGKEMFFEFVFVDSDENFALTLQKEFYDEIKDRAMSVIGKQEEKGFLLVDFSYAENIALEMKKLSER